MYTSTLSDVDRTWLAAIVDGEGTIGLYRSRRPKTKSGWRFYPVISINNTNKRIVDKFALLANPWVSRQRFHENGQGPNNKAIYTIEIKYANTGTFLNEVYPFLVGKNEQADNLFKFLELQRGVGQRNFDIIPQMNELYIQSRLLNARGTKPIDVIQLRADIAPKTFLKEDKENVRQNN